LHSFLLWNDGTPFLAPLRDEPDPNFRSIDPDQFASPKCQSGRRKEQEEFLGTQYFEGSVDLQPGAGCGYVDKNAASPPCAVNAHQVNGIPVFKTNTVGFSIPERH